MRFCILLLAVLCLVACGAETEATICQVKRVIDGDSLRLECKGLPVEVRLWCIDAPEYSQGRWGKGATAYLKHLLSEQSGQVEIKIHDQDRFGRTVAEVLSTGPRPVNFNLSMVQAGHAAVYERYCTSADYAKAEQQARGYGIGIWSRDGLQQRPWEYRRRQGRR